MREWYVELGYEGQLAAWLAVSFLLYTIASQLAWQFQWGVPGQRLYLAREDGLGRLIDHVRDQPFVPWIEQAMRFGYYLGLPFLAVTSGAIGADLLGIKGTDWVEGKSAQGFLWEDWARGSGLAATAILAMWGVWLVGRLLSRRAGLEPPSSGLPSPLWRRTLDALYDQVHWAFYRSGPILWLDDLYGGVFSGLALVLLETALNPACRWALKDPETSAPPLIRLGIAWVSALLFLETHNLWLTVAAHLVLVTLLGWKESTAPGYS
ncbi:MAG: hypothetical protein PVF45_14985 [Anaerolineae bacterium]|jgi:hypothetical protein